MLHHTLAAVPLALLASAALAQPRDVFSDTWVATDALGRSLPGHAECGPPRPDRQVGMFYFLWMGEHAGGKGPFDISKILAQDPEAIHQKDSPLWGPMHAFHHWGEPLFGYYQTDDAYVLRRHAQMLSDAGVDVIIFDVTNRFTYKRWYMALLEVFRQVRADGGNTPQIAFLCPFGSPAGVVRELYEDLYEPGLYPDLWYRWQGKPLILADPGMLSEAIGSIGHDTAARLEPGHTLGQSIVTDRPVGSVGGSFPTWKEKGSALTLSLHRDGPGGETLGRRRFEDVADNAWLRLDFDPSLPPGSYYLQMSNPRGAIGWWSHSGDVFAAGEAYADGVPVPGDRTIRAVPADGAGGISQFFTFRKPQASYFQGPTGPDMWSWLEVYPQHVFRNSKGDKEQMSVGVAQNAVDGRLGSLSEPDSQGRSFHKGAIDTGPDAVLHGLNFAEQWERALQEDPRFVFVTGWNEWIAMRFDGFAGVRAPVVFVDQFDQEHSRDIEPMAGGHGDNYYYQLVSYIRRYKGVRQAPVAGPQKTIDLERGFAQWADVTPEFRDDIGDPARRDHPGYNNHTRYVNTTGRNDFSTLKVSRDRDFLYFYAQTKDPISPHTDPRWMMLYLDTDCDATTGLLGFDYAVNRTVRDATTTVLEAREGDTWQARAELRYRVSGNEMMVAIPRSALGLADTERPLKLHFKWADNTQSDEPEEFWLNGDCAPNGRFCYVYAEGEGGS